MLPAAQDTTPQLRSGIVNAIHQALVTGIGMPEDELFNMVHTYDLRIFVTAAALIVWHGRTI